MLFLSINTIFAAAATTTTTASSSTTTTTTVYNNNHHHHRHHHVDYIFHCKKPEVNQIKSNQFYWLKSKQIGLLPQQYKDTTNI